MVDQFNACNVFSDIICFTTPVYVYLLILGTAIKAIQVTYRFHSLT